MIPYCNDRTFSAPPDRLSGTPLSDLSQLPPVRLLAIAAFGFMTWGIVTVVVSATVRLLT